MNIKSGYSFIIFCLISFAGLAQTAVKVDLQQFSDDQKISIYNRNGGVLKSTEPVMYLDERPNDGVAWLTGESFINGTIEVDIKGKDVYQQSFLGMAFHGTNDSTFNLIYFRPFNFKADDAVRRSHAVQYVCVPKYDWPLLREKFPNKYEQPIDPAPDPDSWFHTKIVVKGVTISVYVNHNTKPALVVQQLAQLNGGKIGFWVGNGSGGEWKNLTISKDQ